jgi:hypothetical protein
VRGEAVRAAVREGRELLGALRGELGATPAGALAVSGLLAEQLARELGAGAEPGAVAVDPPGLHGVEAAVRVLAGEPGDADRALIRDAERAGIPVVVVQLWPQEDRTPPFLLTPFVVECRAGAGFPVDEIAARVAEASAHAPALAARVPVLREAVASALVRRAVVRAALTAALRGRARAVRPQLVREQAGLLARLRVLAGGSASAAAPSALAVPAALACGAGFGLRAVARLGRRSLPGPLADAAVAAAGTWALAEAFRRLGTAAGGASR